ncbi:claudin-20-like isoform X3 [Oryzias latipes]|uniref:claudin-20-like isoform X3 n=1 Tax=Oryzias latipes TaxID=8090 RepID=UPI000CE17AEF|nr:claudin-20-like isoform X3 [Oryzias latipes]
MMRGLSSGRAPSSRSGDPPPSSPELELGNYLLPRLHLYGGGSAMLSADIQILAFGLALLGVLGATVATLMPNWKATRAAMVLCCMLATFGLCLASLGLKCTRWGGSYRAKGHTAIAAGGCFVLSSLLCLVPASWFTNEVITAFLTTDLPDSSKYQPGGALCITFVSAGFLLAGGVIFCLSCPGKRSRWPDQATSSDRNDQRRGRLREKQTKNVKLQTDEPNLGEPEHPPPCRHSSEDLKDSYSLQEYV